MRHFSWRSPSSELHCFSGQKVARGKIWYRNLARLANGMSPEPWIYQWTYVPSNIQNVFQDVSRQLWECMWKIMKVWLIWLVLLVCRQPPAIRPMALVHWWLCGFLWMLCVASFFGASWLLVLNPNMLTPLTTYFAIQGVQDMSFLLVEATDFNEDISGWNTSAVTNMSITDWFREIFTSEVSSSCIFQQVFWHSCVMVCSFFVVLMVNSKVDCLQDIQLSTKPLDTGTLPQS